MEIKLIVHGVDTLRKSHTEPPKLPYQKNSLNSSFRAPSYIYHAAG